MHKNSECIRKAKFLTGVWRAVNVAGYVKLFAPMEACAINTLGKNTIADKANANMAAYFLKTHLFFIRLIFYYC